MIDYRDFICWYWKNLSITEPPIAAGLAMILVASIVAFVLAYILAEPVSRPLTLLLRVREIVAGKWGIDQVASIER